MYNSDKSLSEKIIHREAKSTIYLPTYSVYFTEMFYSFFSLSYQEVKLNSSRIYRPSRRFDVSILLKRTKSHRRENTHIFLAASQIEFSLVSAPESVG